MPLQSTKYTLFMYVYHRTCCSLYQKGGSNRGQQYYNLHMTDTIRCEQSDILYEKTKKSKIL